MRKGQFSTTGRVEWACIEPRGRSSKLDHFSDSLSSDLVEMKKSIQFARVFQFKSLDNLINMIFPLDAVVGIQLFIKSVLVNEQADQTCCANKTVNEPPNRASSWLSRRVMLITCTGSKSTVGTFCNSTSLTINQLESI